MNQLCGTAGHSLTRRRLLLAAPLASAAALAPTMAFAKTDSPVGVLLPDNERIPGLRLDWRHGFQSELLDAGATFQPHYLEYSVGSHRALLAAESLLDAGCTTITGIFNRNLATQLGESLDRRSAKFLVSDLGANAVRGHQSCDRLTRVGPNLWQHAYQAGQHVAQSGAKRALIATSFYEAGYDLPSAFKRGFLAAGGDSADIVVTGTPELPAGDDGFSRIADALSGPTFDVLFSLYSGREAVRYLQFAPSIHAAVGTQISLSSMLHGLPQSAFARAAAMDFEVVTAHSPNVSQADETIYASMGRMAARAVLAALGGSCQKSPEWSTTLARVSAAAQSATDWATPAVTTLSATTLTSPWPAAGAVSGWIAPYGA